MRIDLNADVGESSHPLHVGDDEGLMASITSANVAAGFHAGGPSVLRATIRLAKARGVAVGAHPGLPDRDGFGRREMRLEMPEVEDLVLYQVAAVAGVAAAEGVALAHVKPHGALYTLAARDGSLADAIARAVAAFDRRLILLGPPDSELLKAGLAHGLPVAAEGFADRTYEPDGSLRSREKPGAVLTDPDAAASQGVALARGGRYDTICIHGDTPGAAVLAATLRAALVSAGVIVRALAA
jgi:UPF0271 protein